MGDEVRNLKINRQSGLQCLMYFHFIISDKYPVDAIAQKMGVHRDTLYKWINGTHVFPAEQIINLTNATGDLKYLEYIAEKCGYSIIPKIKDKKTAETMIQMAKIFISATQNKDQADEQKQVKKDVI